MKSLLTIVQALHPPLFLGALCLLVFSWGLGDYSLFFYLGFLGALIFIWDTFNRFTEYKIILRKIRKKKYTTSVLKLFNKSWCQREMIKGAYRTISEWQYKKAKIYYKEQGFRWYHIFPTGTFQKKSIWLKSKFWKATFLSFAKRKHTTKKK